MKNKTSTPWVLIIGLPSAFILIYLGLIYWKIRPIEEYSIANAGMLGDSFGILTAWFSGMAFCAAVYLIYVQKSEFDDIKNHSKMMSKIERASFQPVFQIKGAYNSQGRPADNKLDLAIHPQSNPFFFVFEDVTFEGAIEDFTYKTISSARSIVIEMITPIQNDCNLHFKYRDLTGTTFDGFTENDIDKLVEHVGRLNGHQFGKLTAADSFAALLLNVVSAKYVNESVVKYVASKETFSFEPEGQNRSEHSHRSKTFPTLTTQHNTKTTQHC